MKISANEIKTGMLLEYKNDLWEVLKTQHVKPGKGGAFNQVEMKSINKNTKLNERFRSEQTVEKASIEDGKTGEGCPFTVLINPEIEVLDSELVDGREACLSLPGLAGVVPRYRGIRYTGWDHLGNIIDRKACGYHARVVQHECDHLDGVLYPMRMKDLSTLTFTSEVFRKEIEA